MNTYTTNSAVSLEEQRIEKALAKIKEWIDDCACTGFCESYGCDTLRQIAAILKGEDLG